MTNAWRTATLTGQAISRHCFVKPIADLKLSRLTVPAVRGFRDRQGKDLAAATVVKRLNLLASILNHAMSEWDVPLSLNPASGRMIKRPTGADRKRNRRLQRCSGEPNAPLLPT